MTRPNKQDLIFEFIEEEYKKNGYSPSIGEIAVHLGLSAKSNVHRQLQKLVSDGRLQNLGGRYVPAELVEDEESKAVMVPLLGRVAAGIPITAVENHDGYVAYVPRFGDGNDLFALTIKGDSMINVGIFDGDAVIVEKTPIAENGEIAVVLVGDEATVKTFYRENGHFRLQPENPDYEPIIVENAAILGRVVASIHYFKNRRLINPMC
ncbi:MAG TPA: transcriptional repressor LexA [Ruminiclostridium sp.]|nr:transcriptional repressor LexA [Ruminiclostridium sp.]